MKWLKRFITVVIVLTIFYFLITNLNNNWHKIPRDSLHFNFVNILISLTFLFLNFLIFVEAWRKIIHTLGNAITFSNAFWIMSSSQLAKYIPGGIWFALGRIYLGKTDKLKPETIGISVIIETALTLLVGIILFLFSLLLATRNTISNFLFVVPIAVLFIIFLHPKVLNKLLDWSTHLINRGSVYFRANYLYLLYLSLYFFGLWIAQIIGFYFLINSIYPVPITKIFHLAGAYTLSWMSGFIVIFAPGGLGVREGMMSLLLSSFIPSPLAIAISFLSRVWITVFEIVVFFIGVAIHKASR
ncbi:MAG: lysylphosphatidylglycerol synthase domain-containing protein [candidate division WOR-3 bacterium]